MDGRTDKVRTNHQFGESVSRTSSASQALEDLFLVAAAGFGVATLTIEQTDLLIDRLTPSGLTTNLDE